MTPRELQGEAMRSGKRPKVFFQIARGSPSARLTKNCVFLSELLSLESSEILRGLGELWKTMGGDFGR